MHDDPTPKVLTEADLAGLPRAVSDEPTLLDRLDDEADLCANEGADDISKLLIEAATEIRALVSERDALASRVRELEADAARWRRLVNASEMPFPPATVADDPENDATMLYGRKRLERYIDDLDEIPNVYAALTANTPESKP